jgi:hypothetical protein
LPFPGTPTAEHMIHHTGRSAYCPNTQLNRAALDCQGWAGFFLGRAISARLDVTLVGLLRDQRVGKFLGGGSIAERFGIGLARGAGAARSGRCSPPSPASPYSFQKRENHFSARHPRRILKHPPSVQNSLRWNSSGIDFRAESLFARLFARKPRFMGKAMQRMQCNATKLGAGSVCDILARSARKIASHESADYFTRKLRNKMIAHNRGAPTGGTS